MYVQILQSNRASKHRLDKPTVEIMGYPTYQLHTPPCRNRAIKNDLLTVDLRKINRTSTAYSPNDDVVVIHHGS